jgi:hypothetical protein
MNGLRKGGILYTVEFYSVIKNEILSFAGKWLELKNIILVKLAMFRRSKVTCFLSYVEYRPNINNSNTMEKM